MIVVLIVLMQNNYWKQFGLRSESDERDLRSSPKRKTRHLLTNRMIEGREKGALKHCLLKRRAVHGQLISGSFPRNSSLFTEDFFTVNQREGVLVELRSTVQAEARTHRYCVRSRPRILVRMLPPSASSK
jgi:hypothetical protein